MDLFGKKAIGWPHLLPILACKGDDDRYNHMSLSYWRISGATAFMAMQGRLVVKLLTLNETPEMSGVLDMHADGFH